MAYDNINDKRRMTDPSTESWQIQEITLLDSLRELVDVLWRVAYNLLRSPTINASGQQRISIEWWSVWLAANQTLGTLTTLWSVNTLGWSISTIDQAYATNRVSWAQNVWNRIP